jgi:hypothetical protein
MASIFKRRKGKQEPYSIQYTNHEGKRKTVKDFTDRGLTDQLAGKLETEARLRRTGMVDPGLDRITAQRMVPIATQLKGRLETGSLVRLMTSALIGPPEKRNCP